MAKNLIDIEDIPPQLANKVKQDLRFKMGILCGACGSIFRWTRIR